MLQLRRDGFEHWGWLVCGVVTLLVSPQTAPGLNIILEFNGTSSQNPGYDPDGSLLTAVLQEAATIYEDILEDTHTLTIRYWWDDLPRSGLGVHQNTAHDGLRETRANLRFDTYLPDGTDRRWFIDPTPGDDSEFDMQQGIVEAMSTTARDNAFNGSPPDQFEVGYRGTAVASAPLAANKGFDLLTVALHEIGHGLGVPAVNFGNTETSDGDWDIPPDLLGGLEVGVRTAGTTDQGPFHTQATSTLMSPSVNSGLRERPTATDILAMTSTVGWTQIDLPRKDFLGSSTGNDSWHTASHWIGNRVPDVGDEVYLRHGGSTVWLAGAAVAANLMINGPTHVETRLHSLVVTGQTRLEAGADLVIGDSSNPSSVPAGVGMSTDTLTLGAGGSVITLAGGHLSVISGPITLGSTDALMGVGVVEASVVSGAGGGGGATGSLISPGLPTGLLTIDGDLTLQDSQMLIEIGTMGYDQLSVSGMASLDGRLTLSLLGGFLPSPGEVYDVFWAGGLSGQFDSMDGEIFRLGEGNTALVPVVDLDEASLSLVTTVVGGVDADRHVGYSDLTIMQSHFNQQGGWFEGDMNGDGLIDFFDLTLLQSNFGRSFVAVAPLQGQSVVIPQPASALIILAVSGAGLALPRRDRRMLGCSTPSPTTDATSIRARRVS